MKTLTDIAFGLVAGVLGWLIAEFIVRPVRRGLDAFAEGQVELLRYGNVRAKVQERDEASPKLAPVEDFTGEDEKRLAKAQETFRDIGARLLALAQTERLPSAILRLFGYDAEVAGRAMIGLSNTIHAYGKSRAHFAAEAEKTLRLKRG